jgi:hypothetical protein
MYANLELEGDLGNGNEKKGRFMASISGKWK